MPKLLVIDDEPERTEQIADWFGDAGYEVVRAHSGREGIALARSSRPDVILLDIVMPEMDGHTVLLRLKQNRDTEPIPVVICSIKGDELEGLQELTLRGLREGADYVTARKWSLPALEEVIGRILARPEKASVLRAGGHELRLGEACVEVWVDGEERRLTPLEAGVLSYLYEHRGQPSLVATIEECVWPDHGLAGSQARVRRVIERLRDKIEPDPAHPVFLETVRGHGYKLAGEGEAPA